MSPLLLSVMTGVALADPAPEAPRAGVYAALHTGYAANINDPFLKRRGLHGGVELGPRPELTLGARLGVYPSLGQADWKRLTTQLVDEVRVSPDLSRVTARAELYGRAAPLRVERGSWTSDAGLLVGGGVVRTVDDLEALQAVGDPIAESTEVQLHPTLMLGVSAGLWWEIVGVRVDATRLRYVETVMGDVEERKTPVFLGAELSFRTP